MRCLVIFLFLIISGCVNQSQVKESPQKEIKHYDVSSKIYDIEEPKKIGETDNTITFEVSSSYVMGDGDNRVDAKNMALQQAKTLASEQAGTYIQSEIVIENDKIKKEQITTLTTALMSVTVKNEKYSITSDGRTNLTLTIISTLDKQQFIDKIKSLQQNAYKQKQIIALQRQNKDLLDQLITLSKKITTIKKTDDDVSVVPSKQLFEERNRLLSKINKNEKNIKKVFLEKGGLFKQALYEDNAIEKAKEDILLNFLGAVKESVEYKVGEPKNLRSNGDGTYNFDIVVSYEIRDVDELVGVMRKYFKVDYKSYDDKYSFFTENLWAKYSALKTWLPSEFSERSIYLKVTLGETDHVQNAEVTLSAFSKYLSYGTYYLKERDSVTLTFKEIPLPIIKNLVSIDAELVEVDHHDYR